MEGEKAVKSQGISIQSSYRNIYRYNYDDFSGLSSSPPPAVHREPPKITLRKSKYYSLIGSEHSPAIPEEGTAPTIQNDSCKRKEFTFENNDKSLKKSSSSPSLTTLPIETDSKNFSRQIMGHELTPLTTGCHDIVSPHGSIETEPSTAAVLKMFVKAHKRNYSDDLKQKDMNVAESAHPKSQSVPGSPHISPALRRRNLSGDSTDSSVQGPITSAVMENFSGSSDSLKADQYEHKPITSRAMGFLYHWGGTTKVNVGNKDLNMFAPSSS